MEIWELYLKEKENLTKRLNNKKEVEKILLKITEKTITN